MAKESGGCWDIVPLSSTAGAPYAAQAIPQRRHPEAGKLESPDDRRMTGFAFKLAKPYMESLALSPALLGVSHEATDCRLPH
jgi:hypothetical protein